MAVVDENQRRYRCCCGACRARVGAMFVAGFEAIIAITFLIFAILLQNWAQYHKDVSVRTASAICYVAAGVMAAAVATLVAGIALKQPALLILHMIKSGFVAGGFSVAMLVSVMVLVTVGTGAVFLHHLVDGNERNEEVKTAFVSLSVVVTIVVVMQSIYIGLQIWFIFVVFAALRAIRDANRSGGVVLAPPPQPMVTSEPGVAASCGKAGTNFQLAPYQATTYFPSGNGAPAGVVYAPMNAGYPQANV